MIKLLPFECHETQYPRKVAIKHVYGSFTFWNASSFLRGEAFLSPVYRTEVLQFKKKERRKGIG